jgi:hypothetical protein
MKNWIKNPTDTAKKVQNTLYHILKTYDWMPDVRNICNVGLRFNYAEHRKTTIDYLVGIWLIFLDLASTGIDQVLMIRNFAWLIDLIKIISYGRPDFEYKIKKIMGADIDYRTQQLIVNIRRDSTHNAETELKNILAELEDI